MTDTLRDKLIQKGWVTPFNADTLVRLIEEHYADEPAAPAPPADGEVAELVEWLREQLHVCLQAPWTPGIKHFCRAAELLQRQAPLPVAVSERLPEPSDCAPWPDEPAASAWCWVGSDVDGGWSWEQRSAGCLAAFPDDFTHWLPAHALPVPEAGE